MFMIKFFPIFLNLSACLWFLINVVANKSAETARNEITRRFLAVCLPTITRKTLGDSATG